MAELQLKQGHPARAVHIYRQYVAKYPDNASAAKRLEEIQAMLQSAKGEGIMSFREHIQNIVDNLPGAMAGVVMGFDGIAIDTYEKDTAGLDVSTLLTEYSSTAGQLRKAAKALEQPGSVTEIAIAAENVVALMRPLSEEFFLGVLLKPNSLTGKARYLMRLGSPKILKELT